MNGRAWSPADDAELTRLRVARLTCSAIADVIGRTAIATHKRAARLRLPGPPGWQPAEIAALDRLRAAGETWGAIGDVIGRTEQSVKSRASRTGRTRHFPKGRRWTAPERDRARTMRAEGRTWASIAERLDRPLGGVKAEAVRRGWTTRRPRGRPWSDADDAELLRLYSQPGASYATIADRLGRSRSATAARMSNRYLARLAPVAEAPPDPDWSYRTMRAELRAGNSD